MRTKETTFTVTEATPASASTAAGTTLKSGLFIAGDLFVIDVSITAGTGGTLDVYLQRKIAADTWRDWVHFPQVAAAATKKYTMMISGQKQDAVEVGGGSDASPSPSMAAGSYASVVPGGDVRLVYTAGALTSAAGSVTLILTPYTERH